jgi:hypothetical protein
LVGEGLARQAQEPLQDAVSLREKSHDPTWELAVARERLGEALVAGGGEGGREGGRESGRELLVRAAASLKAELGAGHPEAVRAQRALDRAAR